MSSKIIKTVTQHFFLQIYDGPFVFGEFFSAHIGHFSDFCAAYIFTDHKKLKSKFKLSTIVDLNFQFEFLGREEFAPIITIGLDQSLPSQARTRRY